VSNPDPFAREPRRLLALVPRYQSPGRGHDPPPGHVVVAAGEDVADGPSGAGGPGLRGDLAVGHHLAWPKRPEHPQRASLEGVAASIPHDPQYRRPVILVGTSGWQYRDWRGRFYPKDLPTSRWLEHYATRFRTVEVNNSFYRLPSEDVFAAWRERTPEGFVMTVKASRYITHIQRLRDPREPVELLWSRASALGPRLGPILFQLPPGFARDDERLGGLLEALPSGMRAAFEFRDPSWEVEPVYEWLDAAGAAIVLADRPRARVPHVVTGGWSYLRFHQGLAGRPGYTRDKLRRWARRIAALPARDVFAYFNNDTGAAAVRDAVALTALLERIGCEVAR